MSNQDPETLVIAAKEETNFPSVHNILRCAKDQKCTSQTEHEQTIAFIEILKIYHKEIVQVAKAIQEAGKLLLEKKATYEKYGIKPHQPSIDDL